jgi:hypothetical protein
MAEIHVGDIGTSLEFEIRDEEGDIVDVSGATTKQVTFRRPGGTKFIRTLDFINTGTDGLVKYVTTAGDLDKAGTWKAQVYVVLGGGEWYTTTGTFEVHRNL